MSIAMVMAVLCTLIQSGGIIMNKTMSSKVVALDEMQSNDTRSIAMVMAVLCTLLQSGGIIMNKSMNLVSSSIRKGYTVKVNVIEVKILQKLHHALKMGGCGGNGGDSQLRE